MRSKEEIREISEEIRKNVAIKIYCEEASRMAKKYAPNVMSVAGLNMFMYEQITNRLFVTNKRLADAIMAANGSEEAYEAYKKRVKERLTLEDFYEELGV